MRRAGVRQPIGTNESWWSACNETWPCGRWSFLSRLNWIGTNVYAWWENKFSGLCPCVPAQQAAAFHVARLQNVRTRYSPKEVILTEFGWPAGPNGYRETNRVTGQRCGVASAANQRLVVDATLKLLRSRNLPHVLFAAYRERWKSVEGRVGPYWGILNAPAFR
jgi:exo-beta-1,3-glucanase (GH17 family)